MSAATPEQNIPVFINNRNRLTSLRLQISWLESMGMQRIFVLDNASDYPPLLDYYRSLSHSVLLLRRNTGYMALWESEVYLNFLGESFIYTDSDIIPVEECPPDFLQRFVGVLSRHPDIDKVGFGLKIDDLPDEYAGKAAVLKHEGKFWRKPVEPGVYDADIDTTFALYRPFARGGWWARAFRTGPPYIARHLPWYVNSLEPSEEEKYYMSTASKDSTWAGPVSTCVPPGRRGS